MFNHSIQKVTKKKKRRANTLGEEELESYEHKDSSRAYEHELKKHVTAPLKNKPGLPDKFDIDKFEDEIYLDDVTKKKNKKEESQEVFLLKNSKRLDTEEYKGEEDSIEIFKFGKVDLEAGDSEIEEDNTEQGQNGDAIEMI